MLKIFCHEIPLMPGREIMQLAKNMVAMFFIEIRRLETECIQEGMLRAVFARFVFNQCQKAASISAVPQFFFHPHQINVQPVPIDLGYHTAGDFMV